MSALPGRQEQRAPANGTATSAVPGMPLVSNLHERADQRALVEPWHVERLSQRGMALLPGVRRRTLRAMRKKSTPLNPLAQPMLPAHERQARTGGGIAGGDRTDETCHQGGKSLPADACKRASSSTAGFTRSTAVLPNKRQRIVGKATGETAPIARFTNVALDWSVPHARSAGMISGSTPVSAWSVLRTMRFSHRSYSILHLPHEITGGRR